MKMHAPVAVLAALFIGLATSTSITVSPNNNDEIIFQQGNFRRTCRYTGTQSVLELQVLHNGTVIQQSEASGGEATIMLDLVVADVSDAGTYECRVVFSNGSTSANMSMGTLTVVDLDRIIAPPNQYVVLGQNTTLQCVFTDPNTLYGISFASIKRNSQAIGQITNASLEDEGVYQCDVTLFSHSASALIDFTLHIFTPISITEHPPNYQELTGVQEATFSVTFTGRETQNITTMWYHNGVVLHNTDQHQLRTNYPEPMLGIATIMFPAMARADGGVYRVVVSTEFGTGVIAEELRKQEESFQVDVRVPPPDPTGFGTLLVAEHHVQLGWQLLTAHDDEAAESFQLDLYFPNGSRASSTALPGSARNVDVKILPGVSYRAHLIAENGDGSGESRLNFTTPPAAPSISYFEARRLNDSHFNISITLRYTGGGDTTTFSIYFRESNTIEWSKEPVMIVRLDSASALNWRGVISGEEIRGKGPLEFELRVANGVGFMNRTGAVTEISDRPGVPTPITLTEESATSVTIDFRLPEEGTPPFIGVVLDFTAPQVMAKNYSGTYQPGQTFNAKISGLSPRTAYSLKARAVNYAGDGPDSQLFSFTTSESPPTTDTTTDFMSSIPWLMPAVIGGGVTVVALVVILLLVCCFCYCSHRRKKRANVYNLKNTQTSNRDLHVESARELDPDNEMVQRSDKNPVILGTPPPPSSHKSSMDTIDNKGKMPSATNPYIALPQQDLKDRPPSTASNSPSNQKWRMENSNRRGSSSTLNSGSATQQSQDSFVKKDIFSTTSESYLGSLQMSQQGLHSHRTSKDSLAYYKRKTANPSISSAGSEGTEATERYQAQPFLPPQVEETYSFQSMPFIPEGSYYSEESSQAYSVEPPNQYVSDV